MSKYILDHAVFIKTHIVKGPRLNTILKHTVLDYASFTKTQVLKGPCQQSSQREITRGTSLTPADYQIDNFNFFCSISFKPAKLIIVD